MLQINESHFQSLKVWPSCNTRFWESCSYGFLRVFTCFTSIVQLFSFERIKYHDSFFAPHQRGQLHYGCFKHLHSWSATKVPQPSPLEQLPAAYSTAASSMQQIIFSDSVSICTYFCMQYMKNDALLTKRSRDVASWKKVNWAIPKHKEPTEAQLDKWN